MRLVSLHVQDSVSAGWTDLVGEWQVARFTEDERGLHVTVRSYDSAAAAIRAAQWTRANDNPAADLAVYCADCHQRCSYLFGYVCNNCLRRPATLERTP